MTTMMEEEELQELDDLERKLVRSGRRKAAVAAFFATIFSILFWIAFVAFDLYREWIIWTQ